VHGAKWLWLKMKVTGMSVHAAGVAGWHREWMLKGMTLKHKSVAIMKKIGVYVIMVALNLGLISSGAPKQPRKNVWRWNVLGTAGAHCTHN